MARVSKSADDKVRGIFERPAGSNVWWIRYTDSAGRYKREKTGRRSDALTLYQTRKTDARRGVKLPEQPSASRYDLPAARRRYPRARRTARVQGHAQRRVPA